MPTITLSGYTIAESEWTWVGNVTLDADNYSVVMTTTSPASMLPSWQMSVSAGNENSFDDLYASGVIDIASLTFVPTPGELVMTGLFNGVGLCNFDFGGSLDRPQPGPAPDAPDTSTLSFTDGMTTDIWHDNQTGQTGIQVTNVDGTVRGTTQIR